RRSDGLRQRRRPFRRQARRVLRPSHHATADPAAADRVELLQQDRRGAARRFRPIGSRCRSPAAIRARTQARAVHRLRVRGEVWPNREPRAPGRGRLRWRALRVRREDVVLMRTRTIIATAAATCIVLVVAALAFVYSGVYDVGATTPHWTATEWLL